MSETYCGKSCDECTYRESLGCPGCAAGPGAADSGSCRLASCCRERGHERCRMCLDRGSCEMLKRRGSMPENRAREEAERAAFDARNREKCAFLGKWLWVLFILIVPAIVGDVIGIFPGIVGLIGSVISFAVSITYGVILLKLSRESRDYLIAGICYFAAAVLMFVAAPFIAEENFLAVLILLLFAVPPAFFSEFKEYTAHRAVLDGIDDELAEKWRKLIFWYIFSIVGRVLGNLIPVFGVLILLPASIANIAVKILKLVYLRRTALTFREYYL